MLRSISLVVLVALAAPAMAAELSYNYLEAGYQEVELDPGAGLDVDGHGFGIGGSFEVADSFHIFAAYATSDFDFNADLDEYLVGFGFHAPVTDNVHGVVELAYVKSEVEIFGFSIDDDGYGASVGVRALLGERVELGAGLSYVDMGDGEDTSVGGSLWFYATPSIALGVNAAFADDLTSYGAGLRFYFGR